MNRNCLLSSLVFVSLALILGCSQPANGEDKVVTRADKVSDGPARLAGLMGDVRIENAKREHFAARSGMWLTADDTIKVPSGGLAVVWLKKSNYLVRIADEVEMRIDDIFLLNAPPTERSMAEQIADLLTPDEQKNAERIVGWRAGMRGAETVGHKREKRKEEKVALLEVASEESMAPPEPVQVDPGSPGRGGSAVAPKAKPATASDSRAGAGVGMEASRQVAVDTKKKARKGSRKESRKESRSPHVSKAGPRERGRTKLDDGFGEAEGVQDDALNDAAPKPAESMVWMRVLSGELVTQDGPAPKLLHRMAKDQKLKHILRKLLDFMGQKHVSSLGVRLRLRSGKVNRVWLQGGLPVPKYLREMVIGKFEPGQPDGWVVLELGLR